jgi:hypothetical protein
MTKVIIPINLKGGKMRTRSNMVQMGTKVGAAMGIVAFLIFGIVPGIFFGSYGSLIVVSHLMGGGPVEPTLLVRAAVVVGTIMGVVCIASLTIVTGGIFGTAIGYLVEAVTEPVEVKKPEEATAETK